MKGIILIREMIAVQLSPSKAGHERKFRFELHTQSRVYYLSAETGQVAIHLLPISHLGYGLVAYLAGRYSPRGHSCTRGTVIR